MTPNIPLRTLLPMAVALICLWPLLAGADPASWVVGLPTIALALGAVAMLPGAARVELRVLAFGRLVGAFLRDSIRGAIDVSLRSLARDPTAPSDVVTWRTGLRSPTARLALVHAISLVPGTLTARVREDELHVHVLDSCSPYRAELAALEARIAAAFEPPADPR